MKKFAIDAEHRQDLRDRLAGEPLLDLLARRERPRDHAIDVQRAVEVVDLVLQDARRPPAHVHRLRLPALVEPRHLDLRVALDQRRIPVDAQAPLEEHPPRLPDRPQHRIDKDPDRDLHALALADLVGRQLRHALRRVLEHQNPQ
jgi:hypothetical protein